MVNKRTRYGKDEHSFNGNHLIGISLAPIWAPNPKAVGSFSVLADNWHFKSAIGSLPQPGKLQTAQPSSVTGERKGSQVLVHLPSRSSTQTHKTKKSLPGAPPPPPCVQPRRPGTPSNHRHAPPLLVRRTHRLSIPNAWQLSVVDAVLPPLQHHRHQLWQLSLCAIDMALPLPQPPVAAQATTRPRLPACTDGSQPAASSIPPALDPGVPPGRVGGASVGQAPTSMQQHSTAELDPTARTPSARASASESLF